MKKKYFTEEERKAARAECDRKYREKHKAERAESHKKWYQDNKAEQAEYRRKYYQDNKVEKAEYNRKYNQTPMGRALNLLTGYRRMDRRNGFGDCIDFDAQWIVDNIFTQKCKYCDCTDWMELGCNRINNDLPHIKSNVEPCCWDCNLELAHGEQSIPIAQFDRFSGELIAVWPSANEAAKQLGYSQGHISECCNGKLPQAYGFVWRKLTIEEYETLRACLG